MNASNSTASTYRAQIRDGRRDTPALRALQLAWIAWIALVLVSLLALLMALFVVVNTPATGGSSEAAARWAWIAGGYLIIAVPAVFFWRGRQFRGYWHHEPVAPGTYVRGMAAVWLVLAAGAWLATAACIITRTMVPNAGFAAVALVTLLTLWPKGNAMTDPGGNPGDVGEYEEPR